MSLACFYSIFKKSFMCSFLAELTDCNNWLLVVCVFGSTFIFRAHFVGPFRLIIPVPSSVLNYLFYYLSLLTSVS
jgi:hypothetical protein